MKTVVLPTMAAALAVLLLSGKQTAHQRTLNAVGASIPAEWKSKNFDWMLGGQIAPGKYRYYEAGFGTTCAIVVNAVLERAGIPAYALNRGKYFEVAQHLKRLMHYANARGAYRNGADKISVGDIYYIEEHGNPGNWHTGFVWRLSPGVVVTADGGQSDKKGNQCARFVKREVRQTPNGIDFSGPDGTGWRRVRWHLKAERL